MDDDFNTRAAIETMFQMARFTNKGMKEATLSRAAAGRFVRLIEEFNGILGILPETGSGNSELLDSVMSILIDLRAELRKNKMYAYADMIRDRLSESGIRLEDSADGAVWKKI